MSFARKSILAKDVPPNLRIFMDGQDGFLLGIYWIMEDKKDDMIVFRRCQKTMDGKYVIGDQKMFCGYYDIFEYMTDKERQPKGLVLPIQTPSQIQEINDIYKKSEMAVDFKDDAVYLPE